MWKCDDSRCQKVAVRVLGECILCNRHLCTDHIKTVSHKCPKWENADLYDPAAREAESLEISMLLKQINLVALASQASKLRNGCQCDINPPEYNRDSRSKYMGGMNYHLEIRFTDGITWLARIRRVNATSPPLPLRNYIIQSEVATLQFLEKTTIPTPKVWGYALENENNPVGVAYILMDKMAGKSLRWGAGTESQEQWVIKQLADAFLELERYPFDKMGSLDVPGTNHVGGFARESLTDFVKSGMQLMGPFSSPEDYLTANVNLILDLITREEMYANRLVDAYLIHRALFDLIPTVAKAFEHSSDTKFYLKHADDKGDHILVDDEYNITGIIDWEWAYIAPKAIAFNSPLLLFHVGDFYDGVNALSANETLFAQILQEKAGDNIADIIRSGKLLHRFNFCCGYDLEDWNGFEGLFRGLLTLVGDGAAPSWETWRSMALLKYQEDRRLQDLLSRHADQQAP